MITRYSKKGQPIPVQSYRLDRRRPGQDIQRTCLHCPRIFWTSSRFIRVCAYCKELVGWREGTDFTTTPWRGAG